MGERTLWWCIAALAAALSLGGVTGCSSAEATDEGGDEWAEDGDEYADEDGEWTEDGDGEWTEDGGGEDMGDGGMADEGMAAEDHQEHGFGRGGGFL